jgi:hypothetical protein
MRLRRMQRNLCRNQGLDQIKKVALEASENTRMNPSLQTLIRQPRAFREPHSSKRPHVHAGILL